MTKITVKSLLLDDRKHYSQKFKSMNRILLIALLAGSLAFSSCGNRTAKKEGKEKTEKVSKSKKEDAATLITYTNIVVDYLNATGEWMRSNDSRIEDMLNMMEKKNWTNVMPLLPATTISINKDKFAKITEPPAGVMNKEDNQFFKESMAEIRDNFNALMEDCSELFKYIRNQDYKDDDYAGGQVIADRITERYNLINERKSEVLDKRDELGDQAERVLLQDHPLRDPIFALKDELDNFRELYAVLYAYNDGEATIEEMDAAYKATEESVEKHTGQYAELLEEYREKSSYDQFYKVCDEALGNCRRIMRKAREGRKFDNNDLNTFSSNYNRIISAYNSFNS